MRRSAVRAVVAVVLSGAVLVGCGTQERPDADDWGPIGPVESSSPSESASAGTEPTDTESADTEPGETESVGSAPSSLTEDDLTPDQAQLLSEMVLFRDIAQAEVGDGSGGGSYNFRDDESDFGSGLIRPDGITLADEYELSWADGKLDGYVMRTDSGLRMAYDGSIITLDVAVGEPQDSDLSDVGERLATAVRDWIEQYDESPSFSSDLDTITLQTSLFDEDVSKNVDIPKPADIWMRDSVSTQDGFTANVESEETGERAQLTQDGVTFTAAVEIIPG